MITDVTKNEILKGFGSEEAEFDEFIPYIIECKDKYKLTWVDIQELVNDIFGTSYSESYYRKKYSYLLQRVGKDLEEIEAMNNALLEIKKERVKLADERIQNNAYIRRLAREESIIEIAKYAADKMQNARMLLRPLDTTLKIDGDNEAILCLSDWHYGLICDNYWNKYDTTIALSRVAKLRDETIRHITKHHVKKLHVLNLGDLIAGRIHLTLRLESRIDVITQILEVTEILAEMLAELSNYCEIEYYSCLDNHSRLEPNKSDALDLESLCRITDWHLQQVLGDVINVNQNKYGEDIITFNAKGYKFLALHGDKDKPTQIIDSISRMTEDHYDLICIAHFHHFSCDEKNNTTVIGNGSLMGVDTYAKNLRLSSKPSQNLIIITKDSPCESIYRILV